jgi:DNA-binding NarL/FixJ family response regulator
MGQMPTASVAGHDALARCAWAEARDAFEAAIADGAGADALEGLSWAHWWLSDEARTFETREQAFRAHRAAGDAVGAARMAYWIASDYLDFRGDDAVAAGWLERSRRLLAGAPPCAEHGWLRLIEADLALRTGADPEVIEGHARAGLEIGERFGVADLEAVGRGILGAALVNRGDVQAGMRLLDEGSALATGERFSSPVAPGWTLCCAVSSCEGIGDFPRAAQWCRSLRTLVDAIGARNMVGVCRSAYGNVLATEGDWPAAEGELLAACADLAATRPAMAGSGLVRLGELRARQGRSDEARELFERASGHPQAAAGAGRLALREGDAQGAVDAAERALRRLPPTARLDRVPALELLVRARAELGRCEAAQAPMAELEATAAAVGTPYLRGRAELARAALLLGCGEADAARCAAEDAIDELAASSAPYETAHARLVLARALAALGRPEAAAAAERTARATFEHLGAAADLTAAPGAELTTRELEVLRLVAQGLSDADIAERLVLSPHTVHRHVANVRVKLRLPSRSAAVAHAARAGLL